MAPRKRRIKGSQYVSEPPADKRQPRQNARDILPHRDLFAQANGNRSSSNSSGDIFSVKTWGILLPQRLEKSFFRSGKKNPPALSLEILAL
jgi:hypothetical protein